MIGCSREEDFRNVCVKLRARGLSDRPALELPSFMDAFEGEVTSFLPRGFEKLHFFEGVLWLPAGVTDFKV